MADIVDVPNVVQRTTPQAIPRVLTALVGASVALEALEALEALVVGDLVSFGNVNSASVNVNLADAADSAIFSDEEQVMSTQRYGVVGLSSV